MFVSCNLTDKIYMVYPDKIYVASADGLGPVSTSASAVPTLNNFNSIWYMQDLHCKCKRFKAIGLNEKMIDFFQEL